MLKGGVALGGGASAAPVAKPTSSERPPDVAVIDPLAELASTLKDYMNGTARDNFQGQGRNVNMSFTRDSEPIKLVTQTPRMWCQFGLDSFTPKEAKTPVQPPPLVSWQRTGYGRQPATRSSAPSTRPTSTRRRPTRRGGPSSNNPREIIADRYTPIVKKDGTGNRRSDARQAAVHARPLRRPRLRRRQRAERGRHVVHEGRCALSA